MLSTPDGSTIEILRHDTDLSERALPLRPAYPIPRELRGSWHINAIESPRILHIASHIGMRMILEGSAPDLQRGLLEYQLVFRFYSELSGLFTSEQIIQYERMLGRHRFVKGVSRQFGIESGIYLAQELASSVFSLVTGIRSLVPYSLGTICDLPGHTLSFNSAVVRIKRYLFDGVDKSMAPLFCIAKLTRDRYHHEFVEKLHEFGLSVRVDFPAI